MNGLKISENSLRVLRERYLGRDANGKVTETPLEMYKRVAENISQAEKKNSDRRKYYDLFLSLLINFEFCPNSPTLMNAGRPLQQLSGCYVLTIQDSIEGIFDAVKKAAIIHQSGGGTGFSFSRLRSKGSLISRSFGKASGPISFMKVFNEATEAINQGGFRRGANMGLLRVDHPDILEFIVCKKDLKEINNFNISVAITEDFMEAYENNGEYELIDPHTGPTGKMLAAVDVFRLIVENAWETGEPGIVFIDKIEEDNPTPNLGQIEAVNPCAEQPLLNEESCNLGSINLSRMIKIKGQPSLSKARNKSDYEAVRAEAIKTLTIKGASSSVEIDWENLGTVVDLSVRFLDNVVSMNNFPFSEVKKLTRGNRKIGLGIMGFADLLVMLKIPYNSREALQVAEDVMKFIQERSREYSAKLAKERGVFPNWKHSIFSMDEEKLRNASITTIAPTGSISLICNCSSGIEPLFAVAYNRRMRDRSDNVVNLVMVNSYFEEVARQRGFYSKGLMREVAENGGSIRDMEGIPDDLKEIFVTTRDISAEHHIRVQAAFQKFVDNSISKTINFPEDATVEDVEQAYILAHELGCKGVSVYRLGSRPGEVISTRKKDKRKEARTRPKILYGATIKKPTNLGNIYVTVNKDEFGIRETFVNIGKAGSDLNAAAEGLARMISVALEHNVPIEEVVQQIKDISSKPVASEGGFVKSFVDAVAMALMEYENLIGGKITQQDVRPDKTASGDWCESCGFPLIFIKGCKKCVNCSLGTCD